MTALIYSLALAFLIFLSMSSRMNISLSALEELKGKGGQFIVETIPRVDLPVESIEKILKANEHIIDSFSWVTSSIDNSDKSFIVKAGLDSLTNFQTQSLAIFATQPNYFDTAENQFMMEYYNYLDEDDYSPLLKDLGHSKGKATMLSEVLYTARGSQGLGTFGWIDDLFNVYPLYEQPDRLKNYEYGNFILKVKLESELKRFEYPMRPLWTL